MNKTGTILLVLLGIGLAIILSVYLMGMAINDKIQSMFSPIGDTTHAISTQIASVLHPTPTVIADPVTIIYEVQSLARLETIQYSLEKIITAEIGQNIFKSLFGDKLLFVAHGKVIAGIDLRKLTEDDMWVDGNVLHVRLPESEVFVCTLDNDKSYVYNRETGLFTHGDINLESTARQAAEDEILKSAVSDGILEQAEINGKAFMTQFFNRLGYDKVIIED